jgi:hypothetical protein
VTDPTMRFPVRCPVCGTESLVTVAVSCVTRALRLQDSIALYAPCHDLRWRADHVELEQIRQYLGVAWVHGSMNA